MAATPTAAGWSNWSGSVQAPAQVLRPRDEDELARIITGARNVRATGAGHSFMPLCASDDVILNLSDLAGDIVISADRRRVRAAAGWSLKRLTSALWDQGLALANQGDVNPQSLAGATATGTHGTGKTLGSLAAMVRGARLMGPDGSTRWCSAEENPDLFEAARLSLGLLGIATEIEIDVVPAYYLSERLEKRSWSEVREQWPDLVNQHRHVEFWMFPHSDRVILKTLDLTDPCDPPPSTTDMEESAFRRILDLGARFPFMIPSLQRTLMRTSMDGRRRGPAYAIFPSDRTVPFEEMEYEIPVANGLDALDEVVGWIRKKRLPVAFPFEYRVVAADDIWLSPMNAGPVAAISMHQYAKMPWTDLFKSAEAIFRAHGGRPHWAKRHTLTRADVDSLYPQAEAFRTVRRSADPEGKFLNAHLGALFS